MTLNEVGVVREDDVGLFQPAVALDVHLVRAVDEDVADGGIVQSAFERPQAERLVHDLVDQAFAVAGGQRLRLLRRQLFREGRHLAAQPFPVPAVELRQVKHSTICRCTSAFRPWKHCCGERRIPRRRPLADRDA